MKPRRCEHCRQPLSIGGARGRSPRFCSNRCRTAAFRAHPVPTVMRQRARWIGYTTIDHSGKLLPYWLPGGFWSERRPLSDPSNWASWETVKEEAPDRRGFMLGDGIGCIRIDGCMNGRGTVKPAVLDAVLAMNSYAEVTSNGRSVQVFVMREPESEGQLRVGGFTASVRSTPSTWVPMTGKRITGTPLRCEEFQKIRQLKFVKS
jgi:hypothetical protein